MTEKIICNKSDLTAIADVVRNAANISASYYTSQLAGAVRDCIGIGSENVAKGIIDGSITEINDNIVTNIKEGAFMDCNSLITASFPACTSIGSSAFFYCSALTSISFPLCNIIRPSAFTGCKNLIEVNFPQCSHVQTAAFMSCTKLFYADFPSCSYIGNSAFKSCTSLTSINFPICKSIGSDAFSNCTSLKEISFLKCGVIGDCAFYSCYNLETALIRNSNAVSIYSSAFYKCTDLLNAEIEGSSISIASYAFYSCKNLMSLYIKCLSGIASLRNSNAFYYTPMSNSTYTGSFGSIYVPASLVSKYKTATYWSTYSSRITAIPED